MTARLLDIRDAGPMDIDDDVIAFEDEFDAELAPATCLPRPYPTWVPFHSSRGADD
jgi:hypothetical protein